MKELSLATFLRQRTHSISDAILRIIMTSGLHFRLCPDTTAFIGIKFRTDKLQLMYRVFFSFIRTDNSIPWNLSQSTTWMRHSFPGRTLTSGIFYRRRNAQMAAKTPSLIWWSKMFISCLSGWIGRSFGEFGSFCIFSSFHNILVEP